MLAVLGQFVRFGLVAGLFGLFATLGAIAQTGVLDEAQQPGGSYSGAFDAPTPVASGMVTVRGLGIANRHDFLRFDGLVPGAQTLTITLVRDPDARPGQNSGGEVFFSANPFLFAWDGTSVGTFQLTNGARTRTLRIDLDAGFAGGQLYVGLYFTHGRPISYEISAPGNLAPPPQPPSSGSGADVMQPADAPGGAYSTNFAQPTPVPTGYIAVEGEGDRNRIFFVFNDLPPGVQTLTFEFGFPEDVMPNYWAGGTVLASTSPFRWNWDGTTVGNFAIDPIRRQSTLTLTTAPDFVGTLHVGLYFTYGSRVSFRINVPSNAAVGGAPDIEAGKLVRVIDQRGQGCSRIGEAGRGVAQAAIPGACMEFVISARNRGNGPAPEIEIDDLLGGNLIFVAAEAMGFDGPDGPADFTGPAVNSDCARVRCRISLRNGYLEPGTGGRIVIRTLVK